MVVLWPLLQGIVPPLASAKNGNTAELPPVGVTVHPVACRLPVLGLFRVVQTIDPPAQAGVLTSATVAPETGMASAAANIKIRRISPPSLLRPRTVRGQTSVNTTNAD